MIISAYLGVAGLVDTGYRFYTSAEVAVAARVTAGITDAGDGWYSASVTLPATSASVRWDSTGTSTAIAREYWPDPWGHPVPDGYPSGTAGYVLGTNLDATISSRATPVQVQTELTTYGALKPTVAARTLDVTTTGEAGVDWANIGAPTTTVALTGTTIGTVTTLTNDPAGVTTLLTRIPAALFTGITSLAQWLGMIAGKQAGNTTARTEMRATGAGGGTFDETTDSQEAIRDRGDVSWITGTATDPWNVALPGAYGAGTAGNIVGNNLNATVSSRATPAQVQTELGTYGALKPTVAARTLDVSATGEAGVDWANVGGQGTTVGLTATTIATATTAGSVTNPVTLTAAYDAAKTAATQTSVNTVAGYVDTEVAAIKVTTDKLDTALELDGAVYRYTTNALEQAPTGTGGGGATVAQIWDEPIAGHLIAGSTGAKLNAAASAGDPWSTSLPGAYSAGTAGNILGNRVDVAVSTRATPAQVQTELGTYGALKPTVAARTLDVNATGEAGIDWANIGAPTTTQNLSATTIATVGTLTNAPPDSAGTATLLARIPAALFTGVTSLAQWLGLIAGKQTGNATARTELRATGAGGGTYDETTDSQEATRDRGDVSWITGTPTDPWTVALPGAYSAGQAGKIVGDNLNATVSSRATQTSVDAIKLKTDTIPASPASVGDIPTAIQNADALLKRDMAAVTGEASRSPLNAMRLLRNKWSAVETPNTLTVKKENDVDTAWTASLTTDSAAAPITSADPG